ncbi:hypothetical protein bsdtb5_04750 [Anaeromicropila herbilytica]|uniref:Uncharacterized protein n=1 Tax=Anaeromicropila herbilytica TaxID=2785025 RepID=A0A7R7EI75_9FIRM|nr:hypothetical protein bsdtb5_04750 [Anaeromicropila herbilytica]
MNSFYVLIKHLTILKHMCILSIKEIVQYQIYFNVKHCLLAPTIQNPKEAAIHIESFMLIGAES